MNYKLRFAYNAFVQDGDELPFAQALLEELKPVDHTPEGNPLFSISEILAVIECPESCFRDQVAVQVPLEFDIPYDTHGPDVLVVFKN